MRQTFSAIALVLFAMPPAIGQSLSDAVEPAETTDSQARPDSFTQLSKQLMPAVVNITTS